MPHFAKFKAGVVIIKLKLFHKLNGKKSNKLDEFWVLTVGMLIFHSKLKLIDKIVCKKKK